MESLAGDGLVMMSVHGAATFKRWQLVFIQGEEYRTIKRLKHSGGHFFKKYEKIH